MRININHLEKTNKVIRAEAHYYNAKIEEQNKKEPITEELKQAIEHLSATRVSIGIETAIALMLEENSAIGLIPMNTVLSVLDKVKSTHGNKYTFARELTE